MRPIPRSLKWNISLDFLFLFNNSTEGLRARKIKYEKKFYSRILYLIIIKKYFHLFQHNADNILIIL